MHTYMYVSIPIVISQLCSDDSLAFHNDDDPSDDSDSSSEASDVAVGPAPTGGHGAHVGGRGVARGGCGRGRGRGVGRGSVVGAGADVVCR